MGALNQEINRCLFLFMWDLFPYAMKNKILMLSHIKENSYKQLPTQCTYVWNARIIFHFHIAKREQERKLNEQYILQSVALPDFTVGKFVFLSVTTIWQCDNGFKYQMNEEVVIAKEQSFAFSIPFL